MRLKQLYRSWQCVLVLKRTWLTLQAAFFAFTVALLWIYIRQMREQKAFPHFSHNKTRNANRIDKSSLSIVLFSYNLHFNLFLTVIHPSYTLYSPVCAFKQCL